MGAPVKLHPRLQSVVESEAPLPFEVSRVLEPDGLPMLAQLRQDAYSRHVPEFAASLGRPEVEDLLSDNWVLQVKHIETQALVGTLRIQTNAHGPLELEHDVSLPTKMAHQRLAEAVRLAVVQGPDTTHEVTQLLFKAFYLFCLYGQISHMVIAARRPAARMHERYLFEDLDPRKPFVPLHHAGGLPHRVLAVNVLEAEPRGLAIDHPWARYLLKTWHPSLSPLLTELQREFPAP